jgi:hypothetical protein
MSVATNPEAIERATVTLPVSDVARYLQDTLGQQVVAYITGLKDPKMVGRWAANKGEPRSAATHMRLRYAYEVTRLLADAYGPETARAWLFGSNTRLDDEAPAYLLRYAETPEDIRFIVPAARALVGGAS